jgi:hypothetical protein
MDAQPRNIYLVCRSLEPPNISTLPPGRKRIGVAFMKKPGWISAKSCPPEELEERRRRGDKREKGRCLAATFSARDLPGGRMEGLLQWSEVTRR